MDTGNSERESGNNNNKEHEVDRKNESRMFVGVHLPSDVFIHLYSCISVAVCSFVKASHHHHREKGRRECMSVIDSGGREEG